MMRAYGWPALDLPAMGVKYLSHKTFCVLTDSQRRTRALGHNRNYPVIMAMIIIMAALINMAMLALKASSSNRRFRSSSGGGGGEWQAAERTTAAQAATFTRGKVMSTPP